MSNIHSEKNINNLTPFEKSELEKLLTILFKNRD